MADKREWTKTEPVYIQIRLPVPVLENFRELLFMKYNGKGSEFLWQMIVNETEKFKKEKVGVYA